MVRKARKATIRLASSPDSPSEIAALGDVIFLVGPESTKLRVFSLLLRNSSPVFDAMLGPNFMEGQGLDHSHPKEIALPEDDPVALRIMLSVMHGRTEGIADPLDPDTILAVAIAADKYDCLNCLKYAIKSWITESDSVDPQAVWKLMAAAVTFGDAKSFERYSSHLICSFDRSYLELGKLGGLDSDILLRVCLSLEERRTDIRTSIIHSFIVAKAENALKCGCRRPVSVFRSWISNLEWHNSMLRMSIHEAADLVLKSEISAMPYGVCCSLQRENIAEGALSVAMNEAKSTKGLCLQCMTTGEKHKKHT